METFTFTGPNGQTIEVTADSYLMACEQLIYKLGWGVNE